MLRLSVIFIICFAHFSCYSIQIYNDNAKIKTTNGSLTFKKKPITGSQIDITPTQLKSRSTGYQIQFTAGLLAGKTKLGSEYNMSFNISNGYQFKNGLSLGLGCGAERLSVPVIPFYGELIFHFTDNRFSPYVFLKTGYSFAFVEREDKNYYEDYFNPNQKDSKGGILFNIGIGIANFTWDRAAVVIAIGYRYQRITETLPMWSGMKYELESNFNRIEVKFGFLFR
ncbi:MAG: hypothetical protein AB9846_18355 [Tenuifilaceae bacterium]